MTFFERVENMGLGAVLMLALLEHPTLAVGAMAWAVYSLLLRLALDIVQVNEPARTKRKQEDDPDVLQLEDYR